REAQVLAAGEAPPGERPLALAVAGSVPVGPAVACRHFPALLLQPRTHTRLVPAGVATSATWTGTSYSRVRFCDVRASPARASVMARPSRSKRTRSATWNA